MTIGAFLDHANLIGFGLVSAMLILPRARFIRLFVALFAGLQLARTLTTNHDETVIIWMSVLLGLALLLMIGDLFAHRVIRLTKEEQRMASAILHRVARARARHFIEQGFWLNGRAGDVLLREDEPVQHLYFLSEGEARVMMAGKQVGSCRAGDLIDELAFFSSATAGATVTLAGPARFWCAPAERLRPYFGAHPQLRRSMEKSIARSRATALAKEEPPGTASSPD